MKRTSFIGIDISKKTFDVCIYKSGQATNKFFKKENTQKGFGSMIKELKSLRIDLTESFVCLEYCGVYGLELGFFLEGKIAYCFCNPLHIKRSLGLTRGKNDKLDSLKIARFCYLFRDELQPMRMPSKCMLQLKSLMAERTRITKSIVIEKQVLKDLASTLGVNAKTRAKVRLKILTENKKAVDKEIMEQIKSEESIIKSFNLLVSITGVSLVNATMMILCTNNFEGITNARSFACYCGVAPFEHSSGTSIKGKTRVSQYANKKVKAYLSNAARSALMHDPEIGIYYRRKRQEGKEHGTVMNAIKFKLITRAYAVVKRGTPYVKLRQAG
ncbi:MAG: IS110 family transposase [Prolixibacteraceae bacterium]|nr:IS110 family transposase [Prolixibacteraceae bacterium]